MGQHIVVHPQDQDRFESLLDAIPVETIPSAHLCTCALGIPVIYDPWHARGVVSWVSDDGVRQFSLDEEPEETADDGENWSDLEESWEGDRE